MSRRTWRAGALAAVLLLTVVGVLAPIEVGAADGDVTINATIDGRDVANADDGDPIRLDPQRSPNVVVRVTNGRSQPLPVHSVRVEARAFGLPFVSLESRVDRTVAPGATEEIRFPLETAGLGSQATGLLHTTMTLLDDHRSAVADTDFVADVRGSLWSIEGVFGLTALLFTMVSMTLGLLDVARRRVSSNRWWRALRFAVPGLTFAVAVTFGLAALRLASPRGLVWIPLVVGCGIGGFVAGWFTPGATPEDERMIDLPALERAEAAEPAELPAPPEYTAVSVPVNGPERVAARVPEQAAILQSLGAALPRAEAPRPLEPPDDARLEERVTPSPGSKGRAKPE
jgi:hypothetical protein